MDAKSLSDALVGILHLSALDARLVYAAVASFAAAVSVLVYRFIRRSPPPSTPSNVAPSTGGSDPNKYREDGEWTPIKFDYPPVAPSPKPIEELRPVPYRPFRWGQYHVTMGIRNMPWAEWIEQDDQFPKYHRIKAHRIATRGENVVRVMPENPGLVRSGHEASVELVYELAEYLSRRYPETYQVKRYEAGEKAPDVEGWYGAPAIKSVTIEPMGVTYDIREDNAMEVAGLLVQDDIALMLEGTDGKYYFQAGAICLAGFWRMRDKIGTSMEQIHDSGNVPQYREKLHTSLERFFRRMPVDKPVIRNNYFIQVVTAAHTSAEIEDIDPDELAWSTTTNGPEDTFTHGNRFTPGADALPTPATLRFRTERQTLRRLPRSGAIVFTVRTYLTPVEALGREKGVPGRMASAVRSWGEDVAIYKGQAFYRDVLLGYLDECHREQVESGVISADERVQTPYPF
ncbi:hypothetical protein PLICRDRAFT_234134 [Plicaturopsis crispa FD-325 SS-3]|nr:hypothetical protein PLICRDRAFT_234134 [Plicaturopsis crispa FD-325 SS-3]